MAACVDSERTGLRESPAGSVALEEKKVGNREETLLAEVAENGVFECKDRDVDGESAKTGDNETCDEELEQEEKAGEKGVHRKPADEELDPRIQVSVNINLTNLASIHTRFWLASVFDGYPRTY